MSEQEKGAAGTSLLADGLWMSLSTGLRLGAGLLVFVLVARQLGAAAFGALMAAFSVAAIAAIPVNHGLAVYLLREVPRTPDGGRELLGRAFALKMLVFGVALPAAAALAHLLNADPWLVLILFAMHCVESFTELICVRFRASRHFNRETALMTQQACIHLAVAALTAYYFPNEGAVALAFLSSRMLGAGIALAVQHRTEGWLPRLCFRRVTELHRETRSYFVDFSSQTTLVQLDVVLLNLLTNPVAVGVYQAGMRVVQGLSQAVTIMVNVTLPRLSRIHDERRLGPLLAFKVVSVFALAGILLATPLASAAHQIADVLFGTTFPGLPTVLQALAAFLAIRFLAAGSGVILIALGEQKLRAATMAGAILILLTTGLFLIPRLEALGAALSMVCAFTFILLGNSTLTVIRTVGSRKQ